MCDDIWSLSCVVFPMLTLHRPLPAADMPWRHTTLSGVRKSAHRERMRERQTEQDTGEMRHREGEDWNVNY